MRRVLLLALGVVFLHLSAMAQLTEQQQLQKLNFVFQQIRSNYVDDVPLEPLVEEAVMATLKELDPHSAYLSREEMASLQQRIRGEFAGVGIRYMLHNDTIVVRGIIDGSPAERANISINDRITAIDNRPIVGMPADSIHSLLRGDANSKVSLRIKRRGEDNPLEVNLKRGNIESSAISAAYRIGDIGYIAISKFSNPLVSEFLTVYRELGKIDALVVDLRDNSGGAITSAIDLTGLFLQSGDVIVSTEGRGNTIVYDKKRGDIHLDIPLIVMINENSASASEIFAGAIQDHDRGVIVGRTSFGKGLVQKVIDLKDGTGMTLTIARYKTPSGRVIQRPYAMGEGDEYMRDSLRYMHPDSIPHNQELFYTTLNNHRRVYGGGGITPDVYIGRDSMQLSPRLLKALSESVFEHVAIDIWDSISAEELHERYPTLEAFCTTYSVGSDIMRLFYNRAELSSEELNEHEASFIRTMILATMAERLYGKYSRYYIYGTNLDEMVQHAVSIAGDIESIDEILSGDYR